MIIAPPCHNTMTSSVSGAHVNAILNDFCDIHDWCLHLVPQEFILIPPQQKTKNLIFLQPLQYIQFSNTLFRKWFLLTHHSDSESTACHIANQHKIFIWVILIPEVHEVFYVNSARKHFLLQPFYLLYEWQLS